MSDLLSNSRTVSSSFSASVRGVPGLIVFGKNWIDTPSSLNPSSWSKQSIPSDGWPRSSLFSMTIPVGRVVGATATGTRRPTFISTILPKMR